VKFQSSRLTESAFRPPFRGISQAVALIRTAVPKFLFSRSLFQLALFLFALGTSTSGALAQNLRQLPAASFTQELAGSNAIVQDPTTGKAYRLQVESLPKVRQEWRVATRTRKFFQPTEVTEFETRKMITYQPRYVTAMQRQTRGQWNPFQQTYHAYEYVPEVRWVPVVQYYQIPVTKQRWHATARTEQFYERIGHTETSQRIVATEIGAATARTATQPSPRFGMAYLADKSIGNSSKSIWRSQPVPNSDISGYEPEYFRPGLSGRDVSAIAARQAGNALGNGTAVHSSRHAQPQWQTTQTAMTPTVLR
jgi:hypothetical protein